MNTTADRLLLRRAQIMLWMLFTVVVPMGYIMRAGATAPAEVVEAFPARWAITLFALGGILHSHFTESGRRLTQLHLEVGLYLILTLVSWLNIVNPNQDPYLLGLIMCFAFLPGAFLSARTLGFFALFSILTVSVVSWFLPGSNDQRLYFFSICIISISSGWLIHNDRILFLGNFRDRQNVLSTVLNSMIEGVVLQAADGRIIEFNPSAARILGLNQDDLRPSTSARRRWKVLHEDGVKMAEDQYPTMRALQERRAVLNVVIGVEVPVEGIRWLRMSAVPLFDPSEPESTPHAVVSSFQDITEIRAAENTVAEQQAQLASSRRLSALGEMAAGIGHEINNPLTMIIGAIGQMKRGYDDSPTGPPQEKAMKALVMAENHAKRIAQIVDSLRTLARDEQKDDKRPFAVAKIVEDSLVFARSRAKHSTVDLLIDTSAVENEWVTCHPGEITQVLVNLMRNGVDACDGGEGKTVTLKIRKHPHGKTLVFSVEDNGPGIPEKARVLLMTPFFTTKPVGKGTGLGLSLSNRLLERHDTRLTVESFSNPTRFSFELAIADAQPVSTAS